MTEQDRIIQHEFYKDTFSDKGNCDICGFRRNSHLKDKEKKDFWKIVKEEYYEEPLFCSIPLGKTSIDKPTSFLLYYEKKLSLKGLN